MTISGKTPAALGDWDVAVAGAGPAGIAAAVMAAREGARTVLVDPLAFPGGNATGALLWGFMGRPNGKVLDEVIQRLDALGGVEGRWPKATRYNVEALKLVYVNMLREENVDRFFQTWAEGPLVEDRRARGLVVCNRDGRSVLRSRVVVDATGDAAVAAAGGAPFEKGDPTDGHMQHVSFRWELSGTPLSRYETHALSQKDLARLGAPPDFSWGELRERAAEARARGEITAPEGLIDPHEDTFPFRHNGTLAAGQISLYHVDATDAARVNRAMEECLIAARQVTDFCRKHLPGFANARVAKTPCLLGVRETRRIVGQYVLTAEDEHQGRRFGDGVARSCNGMGQHDAPYGPRLEERREERYKARQESTRVPGEGFEIPLRSLIPSEPAGMLAAGRCISTERLAQGGIRLMSTCSCTGEAAGVAAAAAARVGVSPHELDGPGLRCRIEELGAGGLA